METAQIFHIFCQKTRTGNKSGNWTVTLRSKDASGSKWQMVVEINFLLPEPFVEFSALSLLCHDGMLGSIPCGCIKILPNTHCCLRDQVQDAVQPHVFSIFLMTFSSLFLTQNLTLIVVFPPTRFKMLCSHTWPGWHGPAVEVTNHSLARPLFVITTSSLTVSPYQSSHVLNLPGYPGHRPHILCPLSLSTASGVE